MQYHSAGRAGLPQAGTVSHEAYGLSPAGAHPQPGAHQHAPLILPQQAGHRCLHGRGHARGQCSLSARHAARQHWVPGRSDASSVQLPGPSMLGCLHSSLQEVATSGAFCCSLTMCTLCFLLFILPQAMSAAFCDTLCLQQSPATRPNFNNEAEAVRCTCCDKSKHASH